jgi:dTMP kinase
MSERGRFLTFEGPDGSGKSTQAARLVARLTAAGHSVLHTREPGGTTTGDMIRQLVQHTPSQEDLCAEAEILLFAASRAQLTRAVILPALARGQWVVCDRYADSTAVYQGYGHGADLEEIACVNRMATARTEPDLTLLIDVGPDVSRQRLAARSGEPSYDRMENQAAEFHERVRNGYREWARRFPERMVTIDGEGPADLVERAVWETVQARLP